MSPPPPATPDVPEVRLARAALGALERAASVLRHALTVEPHAAPDVLARLAGLLQATAEDLAVWATWLTPPEEPPT
jgi:hypothetical protein